MAAAQALINAQRAVELGKIPIWKGDGKDEFAADQWIKRMDNNRVTGGWDQATTCGYAYNALRGKALNWHYAVMDRDVDIRNNWDNFRREFLRMYDPQATTRTALANIHLAQGASESVGDYDGRCAQVIREFKATEPPMAIPAVPDNIVAMAGYAAFPEATRNALAVFFINAGRKDAFNMLKRNIFISGLRPKLREEVMKADPATYAEAFTEAEELDIKLADPKKTNHILAVDEGPEEPKPDEGADNEDREVDALHRQNGPRRGQSRGRGHFTTQRGRVSSRGRSSPRVPNGNGNPNAKCRYCQRTGHLQADCFKRKRENGTMVDQHGKPYRSVNEAEQQEEEAGHYFAAPNQEVASVWTQGGYLNC